jgi:hypothetical protein
MEKNYTVNFMSSIYERATGTISWLGSDAHTQIAAQTFASDFSNVHALAVLLNNEYFTRLWVVQEVLLAQEVHVLCGTAWIMLADMQKCAQARETLVHGLVYNASLYLLHDRGRIGSASYHRAYRTFDQCVERYSENECKHPHDKVYALTIIDISSLPSNICTRDGSPEKIRSVKSVWRNQSNKSCGFCCRFQVQLLVSHAG